MGATAVQEPAFLHEAMLYAGLDGFVDTVGGYIADSLEAGEPVLVAVTQHKTDLLKDVLKKNIRDAPGLLDFVDMENVGRNPGRIIPVWRDWVRDQTGGGRRIRGVGEPVWFGRSPAEITECRQHEQLLNLAFGGAPAWWLVCPYDTAALPAEVVDGAWATHPSALRATGDRDASGLWDPHDLTDVLRGELPEPEGPYETVPFTSGGLPAVRIAVTRRTAAAGLPDLRAREFVVAVSEAAANSLRHADGSGVLRIWREGRALVCEVRDSGLIEQPLAGRMRPTPSQDGGRGLWLIHQICDLVRIRSSRDGGTVVRLHINVAED
jgi:anti-sigma regulatory factor (Ser/Thr protein kinase)